MTPERRARTGAVPRALQCAAAGTSALLLSALVVGAVLGPDDGADGAAVPRGHHGTVLAGAAPADAATATGTDGAPSGTAATAELAPGTKIGADGRVVHDHGDLEVTVMLAADGGTEVLGPVAPGASISLVNHTTADQVLTTDDGALQVDVPLVQLVTARAPDVPGTYRLVSRTDRTVSAEILVVDETEPGSAGTSTDGDDDAAVVTALDDQVVAPTS